MPAVDRKTNVIRLRGEQQDAQTSLKQQLWETRTRSIELTGPLSPEDMVVQAMDDASPTKWHLAHTTWFFETFVLAPFLKGYRVFDEAFNYCFNSYYESQGPRQPRATRGLLTRPSIERVFAYRKYVDDGLRALCDADRGKSNAEIYQRIELGINHEQQHQELILTDILALFAANPVRPAYQTAIPSKDDVPHQMIRWITYPGGIYRAGHADEGFCWDNERPYHEILVHPFRLADRLITNGDWQGFIEDGGYATPSLWLADGWVTVNRENWNCPLYWEKGDHGWSQMSLQGLQPLHASDPVAHVSFYEADAFARWAGKRLPTEFEWEVAAAHVQRKPLTSPKSSFKPFPANGARTETPKQLFGDVWQWTSSAYLPYPGYRPPTGAVGEYNGKFMVSQQVLRGSSCVTPDDHSRVTYRNFFYPHQRWQFAGLRLAADIE